MPTVKPHCKQNVGGLGAAVRGPRIVRRALEMGIPKIDITATMASRRKNHQAQRRGLDATSLLERQDSDA